MYNRSLLEGCYGPWVSVWSLCMVVGARGAKPNILEVGFCSKSYAAWFLHSTTWILPAALAAAAYCTNPSDSCYWRLGLQYHINNAGLTQPCNMPPLDHYLLHC